MSQKHITNQCIHTYVSVHFDPFSPHSNTKRSPHANHCCRKSEPPATSRNAQRGKYVCLTQLDVVGVEQEVGQVEELRDQLPDVAHVVSGGRLPLFLHAVEHPLCDVKAALRAGGGTERESWRREEPDFAPVHAGKRRLPDLLQQTEFRALHCVKRAGNICRYLKEAFHLSAKFYNL